MELPVSALLADGWSASPEGLPTGWCMLTDAPQSLWPSWRHRLGLHTPPRPAVLGQRSAANATRRSMFVEPCRAALARVHLDRPRRTLGRSAARTVSTVAGQPSHCRAYAPPSAAGARGVGADLDVR